MKRACLLFIIMVLTIALVACKYQTVVLHCDGENCNNTVKVKVDKNSDPDESWVVFCQKCSNDVLND